MNEFLDLLENLQDLIESNLEEYTKSLLIQLRSLLINGQHNSQEEVIEVSRKIIECHYATDGEFLKICSVLQKSIELF